MFLFKVGDVYYLFFSDESGARYKISTRCREKSEAFTFLQQFKRNEFERRKKQKTISFSDFTEQFKDYSSGVHSLKTQKPIQRFSKNSFALKGTSCCTPLVFVNSNISSVR